MINFKHQAKVRASKRNGWLRTPRLEALERRALLAGDITFAEPDEYTFRVPAISSTVADIDHDGTLDIITGLSQSTVKVLSGNGDGTFNATSTRTLSSGWRAIVGDFDGDGDLDLARSGEEPGRLRIALNQGGTGSDWEGFGRSETVAENPIRFLGLTKGDFDSDGDLDIAVGTNDDRVVVSLNNGVSDGQWNGMAEPVEYIHSNFEFPAEVMTGDIDNDGDLDLLVSNYFGGDLSVLIGDGRGQFADPVNYPVGNRGLDRLGVGDIDGDGNIDITVPHYVNTTYAEGTDRIGVLRGNGDGTFAPLESFEAPGTIGPLTIQDLDNDGDLDIVGGGGPTGDSDIHILANNGDGTFEAMGSFKSSGKTLNLTGADLDHDGLVDLVASHAFFDNMISVHLNTTEPVSPSGTSEVFDVNGDGAFNQLDINQVLQAGKYLSGEPASTSEGDWNRDGFFNQLDIVAALATGTYVTQSQASHRGSPHGGGSGGGGGKETFVGLCVDIKPGYSIQAVPNFPSDLSYCDGVDRVMAITGVGFRLDTTNGSQKVIDKNMKRSVLFDFAGAGFSVTPDDGNGDEEVVAGVDARIGDETDSNGIVTGAGRLNLREMAPDTLTYAEFNIVFGFENGQGDEETWWLSYGTPPGGSEIVGAPVEVIAMDTTGDDVSDSWTIKTQAIDPNAGLRVQEGPEHGEGYMPFQWTLTLPLQ